jgi:hypothetical protein
MKTLAEPRAVGLLETLIWGWRRTDHHLRQFAV